MTLTWKDLPVEMLHSILDRLPDRNSTTTIAQCTFVCKGWRSAAEYQLYSRVEIESREMLIKFNRTITEGESNVAELVKRLEIGRYLDSGDFTKDHLLFKLLSNLPQLQHFSCEDSACYIHVADSLLNGKLLGLRTVKGPSELYGERYAYSNDYITCALLLKDRLENLTLNCRSDNYYLLKDRFHQFAKVEKVKFIGEHMDLEKYLEPILRTLASLKVLKIDYKSEPMEEECSLPYLPAANIRTLKINSTYLEPRHIAYIMQKFSGLESLELRAKCILTDGQILERFISHLSKLNRLTIDSIISDKESIPGNVGNYWKMMNLRSPRLLETVFFGIGRTPLLNLQYDVDAGGGSIISTCHLPLALKKLIVYHGLYIGSLQILCKPDSPTETEAIEELFMAIATNCENLKNLSIDYCYVNSSNDIHTLRNINKRRPNLKSVNFEACDVSLNGLYILLGCCDHIDSLYFKDCNFRDIDNNLTPWIYLHLPDTRVGSITINTYENPHRQYQYLLSSISKIVEGTLELQEFFYMYDFYTMEGKFFKQIEKEEFNDEKYRFVLHIHLTCQSFESLSVTRFDRFYYVPSIKLI